MKLRTGILVFLMLTVLFPAMPNQISAQADRGSRGVFARAECNHSSGSGGSTFEATVKNQMGYPILVTYARGFTSGESLNPQFGLIEPDPFTAVDIADGASKTISGAWDVFADENGPNVDGGLVLVVTTAGLLTTVCGGEFEGLVSVPGDLPATDSDMQQETVEAFVDTYGWLLSWHAYPALYSLLHDDVKDSLSFWQVTCSLSDVYGTWKDWKEIVFSTEVTDVEYGDWAWEAGTIHYPDAAQVAYDIEVGTLQKANVVEETLHLVEVDGAWRWFFGTNLSDVADLPDTCDAR